MEWCTCGMTECKLLTAAEDMTTLLKLESSEEYASQLLFHKYWLARGRHCLRNEKVSISLFGMILESPKYCTLAISLYTVKLSHLLLHAIEMSLGNGLICIVYRYMFVGVMSVNINGWMRMGEVTFKSYHSSDLTHI